MSNLRSVLEKAGDPEDKVRVDISYDIIRHVSAQLYTNPRKAIEELVCNSYDAGATECHVALPQEGQDALIVLDNGKSMDLGGLKDLWMVAKSPKESDSNPERLVNNRLQIGKFGVGKLAAYALGKRLTHVATTRGMTRVISVGQEQIKGRTSGSAPQFQVYKLQATKARMLLEPFFGSLPRPWERNWKSWTMALVEDVDESNFQRALKIGILRRMISTALPVFKDFTVHLEGEEVPGRQISPTEIELKVDVTKPTFRKKLEAVLQEYWAEFQHIEVDDVSPELYKVTVVKIRDPHDTNKKLPAIHVPQLGAVEGWAILAQNSLNPKKLEERGYANNGFAVYTRGKLVNPEDVLFGITPRSHAYWRKFLARLEIPGLDDVLLVQRNAVSENSTKAHLAREVMRALFNFTRLESLEREEAEDFTPRSFGSKIRTGSPLLAPLALEGLAAGAVPDGGVAAVDIDFLSFGEDAPAARYDAESHTIQLNEDHPLVAALDDLRSEDQKQWRRVIGEVVAGEKLTEGLLLAKGVDEEIVAEARDLLDAALRSAASHIRDPIEEHIREIEEASYEGDRRFENAVVNAFRSLRLVARRIAGSDNPDGIVEIPVTGAKNLRISVEAKGTKGIITHKELHEATVKRHSGDYKCDCAIAIAREYQIAGKGRRDSALLREVTGKLPLLTVDAIAKLLRLHRQRPFTYDKVEKILTTWTRPDKLEGFIEATWRELPELGLMKLVLTVAHQKMHEQDQNVPDPGMLVGDARLVRRKVTKEQVKHILEAVAITTEMVVIKSPDYEFEIKAPVDTILEAMTHAAEEEISESGGKADDLRGKPAKGKRKLRAKT